MQVTVLGRWSPYPRGGEACSGYLIEHGDTCLLLECGNGVFSKVEQYASFWKLNAIVCSHLHADHCGDLPIIRNAVKSGMLYQKIKDKMPVFLPSIPESNFDIISTYQDGLNLIIIEKLPNMGTVKSAVVNGTFTVSFFNVQHSMTSYGVIIEAGGKRLVYTGDTQLFPELEAYAAGADLLISEATVLNRNKDYAVGKHLTATQAGSLARSSGVKKFLPSHFFPEYPLDEVKYEIEQGYGSRVEMAAEGMVIVL